VQMVERYQSLYDSVLGQLKTSRAAA
jgi:hypothetical protein